MALIDSCLNAGPIGSGTIRRYGLIGGSVSHCTQALQSHFFKLPQATPVGDSSLPVTCGPRCKKPQLALQDPICLHAVMLPVHDDNGLSL